MNPETLKAMKEAAVRATPGQLEARLGSGNNVCTAVASIDPSCFDEFFADVLPDYACKPGIALRWEANREFLIACSPANVSALIAERDELEAELERQAQEIEKYLAEILELVNAAVVRVGASKGSEGRG